MDVRRRVALWSLGSGVALTLLAAGPAFEEYTSRTGALEFRPAVVERVDLDSGTSLEGTWYAQEITFRLPGEGTVTKSDRGTYVPDIDEGESATLGFSHGVLITVNGVRVRPHPYMLNFLTPVMAGAFVLAAIWGLPRGRRRPWDPEPYTAGYVTQGVLLCAAFGLLIDPPWWPAAATVVGVAVPLLIFAVRYRQVTATARPG
jgi:hypothetical protein